MLRFTIATLLKLSPFLLLANPVSAVGCFSGGQQESAEVLETPISQACGTLAKAYTGGETDKTCIDLPDGNSANFAVELASGAADASLSVSDCIDQNEITAGGCSSRGGIRQFNSFQLTLDPNSGSC